MRYTIVAYVVGCIIVIAGGKHAPEDTKTSRSTTFFLFAHIQAANVRRTDIERG